MSYQVSYLSILFYLFDCHQKIQSEQYKNMDPKQATVESVTLRTFSTEEQLNWIQKIMRQELAEPYSLFTYTNFLTIWPDLAIMAYLGNKIIGTIIGSYDTANPKKSYIAMLVVEKQYRRLKVGKKLFQQFYNRVKTGGATKIVLQTQCCNTAALRFYTTLGFFKTRRMLNYYLSGNDAFRLKLYIPENVEREKDGKGDKKGQQIKQETKKQTGEKDAGETEGEQKEQKNVK